MTDNISLSVELRAYVRDQWNALCMTTNASQKLSILTDVSMLLPSCKTQQHPFFGDTITLRNARTLFANYHYARFAENVLSLITVDWVTDFTSVQTKNTLDSFFLDGIPCEVFSLLCSTVYNSGPSYRKNKCVLWLQGMLERDVLKTLILEQVDVDRDEKTKKSDIWDELLTSLASFPDKMANSLKHENSDLFQAASYLPRLSNSLVSSLEKCHDLLLKGKDCSLEFSSRLLGKVCLIGHSELVWSHLLPPLLVLVKKDCIWWRLCERLITGVPDRCLESVLIPLLSRVPWYGSVENLLGDSILHNHKIEYLLCTKLLLMRHFEQTNLLQNVLGYLSSSNSRKHLLKMCFSKVLRVWSDGSAIRHTSYQQHLYLSKAILITLSFIPASDRHHYKADCLKDLMSGMQHHLNDPDIKTRSLGMIVAESFTKTLEPNGPQLDFEYKKDEQMTELLSLLTPPEDAGVELIQSEMPSMSLAEKAESLPDQTKDEGGDRNPDLDSDDDLEPYDMSNDIPVRKVKKPYYIRDCMEGLIVNDNPDQTEVCLQTTEPLIRSNPDGLKEISAEFMKILLHLSGEEAIPDFRSLRFKAMVALTTHSPQQAAPYLTQEFYGANYNLRQRLDILQVISASAQELSSPVLVGSEASAPLGEMIEPNSDTTETESWREIVQRRIEKKTRRFGQSRKTRSEGTANRFAPVAGLFFFPLILHYDRKQSTLDLLGEDTVVLSRLLYTVGTVLHSAVNTPVVLQMGATGLEFIWALRYHTDGSVRVAVLFCCAMLCLSVPGHYLLSTLQTEVTELKLWLQDVLERDVNEECRQLAVQVLLLLDGLIKQLSIKCQTEDSRRHAKQVVQAWSKEMIPEGLSEI